jgi:hypothetical protein
VTVGGWILVDAIQNVQKIFFRRLVNQNMAAVSRFSSFSLMDFDLPWLSKSRRLRALRLTKAIECAIIPASKDTREMREKLTFCVGRFLDLEK